MKIAKTVLSNGLRLITVPMSATETVTVVVIVGTGSKYETPETSGLSHFLEHMMFKGTEKRPNTKILSETLDRVGGVFNAFTGSEYTGYWIKVDASRLELALDVLSDMLLNSKISGAEIEREKGVILEEIKMYKDQPMDYVAELYEKLLYRDQPAGWPVIGQEKTVKSFVRKDFLDYRQSQYKGNNTVIAIAGNIKKFAIDKYFSAFSKGGFQEKPRVKEAQTKPEMLSLEKEVDQTHLMIGVRAYDLFHPDRYTLSLLASILGGMMSSRIWLAVRERQGLAYSVRTMAEVTTDTGTLVTQAGVHHNKIEQTIKAIILEYKKVKEKKVLKEELDKAKDNIRGKLLIGMEASDAVASSLAMQEILTKKVLTPRQVISRLNQVTAQDIQRVAQDIFKNERLNLCLIAPKEPKSLDKLLYL